MFFYTLIFRDAFEFDDNGCLLSIEIPSPTSVEIIDVSAGIEFDVLLVLLSFKLKRRTGVLEIIRLKIINE
jgi:hypothetical protein